MKKEKFKNKLDLFEEMSIFRSGAGNVQNEHGTLSYQIIGKLPLKSWGKKREATLKRLPLAKDKTL